MFPSLIPCSANYSDYILRVRPYLDNELLPSSISSEFMSESISVKCVSNIRTIERDHDSTASTYFGFVWNLIIQDRIINRLVNGRQQNDETTKLLSFETQERVGQ